jgi:hypothetical protein
MTTDRPPSSRPHPSGDLELSQARGSLRDALSGVKNLDQLLRSIRVGSKAVASVIPDVHASCVTIRSASNQLLGAIAQKLLDPRPIEELRAFIDPRVCELEQGLGGARHKTMSAKNRLALEGMVTRLSRELDAARDLIDLLEDASWGPTVRVDLQELVRESLKPVGREPNGSVKLSATLSLPAERVDVFVNPRVAMGLLTIGVRLLAADAATKPHIALSSEPPRVSIRRGPGEGERVVVPARTLIAPTEICMQAAASLCAVAIDRQADALALSWPTNREEREPKPA